MCICWPNGKFNFKFPRSYNCANKKGMKSKRALSLISECSEEDDINGKLPIKHKNGIKKDIWLTADCENNHGQIRQLSRDRQLPPVPDDVKGAILQLNSPRKSAAKHSNSHSMAGAKVDQYPTRRATEEESSIYESGTYAESKSATQSPCSKQLNQFPLLSMEDARELDPLYSSVLPQSDIRKGQSVDLIKKKPQSYKSNVLQNEQNRLTKEYPADRMWSDHLYSTIVKNNFSSLRKPSRLHSAIRDYPYQSLQSLNNSAPGVPLRLYKLSELTDLINLADPGVELRKCTPADSKSNSLRRFSHPNSTCTENVQSPQTFDEGQKEVDVLRRIQSQYNTPPITRASMSDVRQLHLEVDALSSHSRCSSEVGKAVANSTLGHIVVPESPTPIRDNDGQSDRCRPSIISPVNVYEGLYETLYYSTAEPGRTSRDTDDDVAIEIPNPLPYLGQDNYISISDNPPILNLHNAHSSNSRFTRPPMDRSSAIYATSGSDVYAEISDAYLSRQYEELPEQRQSGKGGGQINNGYIGSPGTLRVLLEIQSFRHMDSDVDVSSRCGTPLHPLARSITGPSRTDLAPVGMVRHPWFLPQRASDKTSIVAVLPKLSQSHLAIMTPLMERSMEGSTMFLEDTRGLGTCLEEYDLVRRKRSGKLRLVGEEQGQTGGDDSGDTVGTVTRVSYPHLSRCLAE